MAKLEQDFKEFIELLLPQKIVKPKKNNVMEAIAFQIKLDSDTIQLPNLGRFIGKDVIVTIIEVPVDYKPKIKKWLYIGSVELNGQLDNKNIRDIAYE